MKLRKLKLAGFKSFVDPTTVEFNSQLVGVVGPNGCGKSNIIDAVRWVMGESSAKNLRGGSMADVIFNGSSGRKPIGQASIELVFDNCEGKLGGEYSAYSEISIKRDVRRDGQSDYYLNGTKCRRRDITDIFLGTGLGPRSYSIIEQGMISRVIEAKPENLRAFIEEAAGISVYKKRRHDTELRLKHTRENLERIEDLIQEQERLLEKLKRQSSAAMRYKDYAAEKNELDLQLKAMRWRDFDKDLQTKTLAIKAVSNKLEEKLARRASIDNQLASIKVDHNKKTDIVSKIQASYYEIGTEITKREQTLKHQHERQEQLQLDLLNAKDTSSKIQEELLADQEKLAEYEQQLAEIEPEYQEVLEISGVYNEHLADAKEKLSTWNEKWDEFQIEINEAQKKAEVEKAKIEQMEKQIREFQVNIDRLEQEKELLSDEEFSDLIAELSSNIAEKETMEQEILAKLEDLDSEIKQVLQQQKENNKAIDEIKEKSRILKGKEASLSALQQAAMGKEDKDLEQWLDSQNLNNLPRLAESISVAKDFEKALETVLGDYLEAVCIDDLPNVVAQHKSIAGLNSGKLLLVNKSSESLNSFDDSNNAINATKLSTCVTTELAITDLLAGIYVVDDLDTALELAASLHNNQSIVTKCGIWLGKNWLRFNRARDAKDGILAREKQLTQISTDLEKLDAEQLELQQNQDELSNIVASLEESYDDLRQNQQVVVSELRELSSKLSSHKTQLDHVNKRELRINTEIAELTDKLESNTEIVNASRLDLEGYIESMANLSEQEESIRSGKDDIEEQYSQAELNARDSKDRLHSLSLDRQTLVTQVEGIKNGITRLTSNLENISERQQSLEAKLEEATPESTIQAELESLLEERVKVEESLNVARSELEELNEQVSSLDTERHEIERFAESTHAELDKVKMEWQSLEVRKDTIQEEFAKAEINVDEILNELPENANESEWDERINELATKIERLGPINLAAIEEYKSESERSNYLQSQHKDLNEAHETLENAIKQIDKETKASFKETYDRVNTNFKELFPRLFGGGQAYLDLTGDDLLETGVTVMAQPPGKKNSSIQLLSGGEKALTAVALVFSIFQLNPAPFCMLDEVDAPLDDSNVGRFCRMIEEMSDKVQFIVITHNKITMEIARQLAGVTMKEPGVSRLVTVDIDQAVKMVEA